LGHIQWGFPRPEEHQDNYLEEVVQVAQKTTLSPLERHGVTLSMSGQFVWPNKDRRKSEEKQKINEFLFLRQNSISQ